MTTPGNELPYRQLAVVDRNAHISDVDVAHLEKMGIKVIEVDGEPHRVFVPITVYQTALKTATGLG